MTNSPAHIASTSHVIEGTLAGCDLTIVYNAPLGTAGAYILSLNRDPHSYCRSLTAAELAALARLNPDDGVPAAARQIVADLTVFATVLAGDWEGLLIYQGGRQVPNALLTPLGIDDLRELGRCASALVAALGVPR